MSIASELTALNGYILGAYDEINTKGGTVPANKNMANLASAIGSISTGSSTTIVPLEVTENGTYTAPTGTAYSPVTVNVSGGGNINDNWGKIMRRESTELFDNLYYSSSLNGIFDAGTNSGSPFKSITKASFPALYSITSGYTFRRWDKLAHLNIPELQVLAGNDVFYYCSELLEFVAPKIKTITASKPFQYCSKLKKVDLGEPTKIPSYFLNNATAVEALIIRKSSVTTAASYAINGATKIQNNTGGYIYVPSALVNSYKAANYWSTYASQIRAIEDYSSDGTVNGDINV